MNKADLKKLIDTLQKEISSLEKDSINPAIIKDIPRLKEVSQKLSQKKEEFSTLSELSRILDQIEETEQMLLSEKDSGLLTLAEEELSQLKKRKDELEQKMAQEESSSQNVKACIVEIRAGTGGEESNLFASDLFRMYSKYAESKGWKIQILSKNQTGTGGFKEVIFQINGSECYKNLKYENGVHRVQRVPVTESSGRIHTSATSVVVYPLVDEKEVNIDPNDLRIDVYRSGGAGGQCVNRTDSAVRITHIPTGIVISCQDERSQHKNKKKALSILASRLSDMEREKQQEELSDIRKSAIQTGDRSAKVRTYNFPQSRITDHRIKKSWHDLKGILEGNLEPIVGALQEAK